MPKLATAEGTHRYAARFADRAAAGHFREQASTGLQLSSIGIGTYLGEPDAATDVGYTLAVVTAVEGGINLVDTAINYRFQRSERSIGAALQELAAKGIARDEIVLCTKAGFLTPDGEMPGDANEYFVREYLQPGVFRPEDIAADCHCMATPYLADQLARSLKNLGVESIDVFYLHNPETQLAAISRELFMQRLRDAFEFLEHEVAAGRIGAYGLATWNGFRQQRGARDFLSLEEMIGAARAVAGEAHHFRFVQLPFNLAMPEALTLVNQTMDGRQGSTLQAARALGITVVSSAALLQGQLTKNLPPFVSAALGLKNDLQRAMQFARSTPGVTSALVGMSRPEHVRENLEIIGVEPAAREQYLKIFERGH
ncbi:MAG TPA: aldo/keto reductase [Candidatus Acidoferrales bacterium]|nr:aldo/keto reductase [Candidatus Acidoferrales bacterium]